MKNAILLLAALILSSGIAHSQTLSFGLKGGAAIATQAIQYNRDADSALPFELNDPTVSSVTGFAAGVFVRVGFGLFAVQPELLYIMKGSEEKFQQTEFGVQINYSAKTTLNYIEIPVLLRFNLPVPGPVTPHLYAGPALSFLTGSKANNKFSVKSPFFNTNTDTTSSDLEYISSNDMGIVFGGGIDFNIGVTRLGIEARYNPGLSDIFKKQEDGGEIYSSIKNRTFMILASVAF